MADPPLPSPWQPPAPAPPGSNPWTSRCSTGQRVGPGCSNGRISTARASRRSTKRSDDSISLMDLISLLHRFLTNQLSDSELVQVIQMGSYFARNKLSFTLASANFDRWLIAGSLADLADHEARSHHEPRSHRRRALWKALRRDCRRYQQPPLGASGHQVPGVRGYAYRTLGQTYRGQPGRKPAARRGQWKHSMWKTGTLTSNSSLSDIYNAVGGVFLVSQVNVELEVLNTGGWRVTIADWQAWFWDTYDWNLAGQSVVIPLDLFNRLPAIAPYQFTIEAMLNATGIPPSVLQETQSGGCTDGGRSRARRLPCRTEAPCSRRPTRSTATVRGISMRAAARAASRSI